MTHDTRSGLCSLRLRRFFYGTGLGLLLTAASPLLGPAGASEAPITPVKDPRALTELKAMGDALAGASSMSFNTSTMTPVRGPNEQWVHVFATAQVEMQRPNQLFVVTGGDAFPQSVYFDGHQFSVNSVEKKLYTQSKMSGSIDTMLAQASKKGGTTFPFADVLLSDPFASWTEGLEGAVYVGESTRGGESLRHLALTAKSVDWEVWLDAVTHLPRMVFVKYTGASRSPSVLIEFSKWKLNASIAASDFAFKAPVGAKKIELKAPEGANK
jgi:hypothetical protein